MGLILLSNEDLDITNDEAQRAFDDLLFIFVAEVKYHSHMHDLLNNLIQVANSERLMLKEDTREAFIVKAFWQIVMAFF